MPVANNNIYALHGLHLLDLMDEDDRHHKWHEARANGLGYPTARSNSQKAADRLSVTPQAPNPDLYEDDEHGYEHLPLQLEDHFKDHYEAEDLPEIGDYPYADPDQET